MGVLYPQYPPLPPPLILYINNNVSSHHTQFFSQFKILNIISLFWVNVWFYNVSILLYIFRLEISDY